MTSVGCAIFKFWLYQFISEYFELLCLVEMVRNPLEPLLSQVALVAMFFSAWCTVFTTQLYIHAAGGKRKKTAAPIDCNASCFCRQFYRSDQSEIQCTACSRWCHTPCAFPGAPVKLITANEVSWRCPACAKS